MGLPPLNRSCKAQMHRCRIVYGGSHFRCRKCHGLGYESRFKDPIRRVASQRHKIRERLGQVSSLEDPFRAKSDCMNWTAYRRLSKRDEALSSLYL